MLYHSLGPLGCIPSQRVKSTTGECLSQVNLYVQEFNSRVKNLIFTLNSQLPYAQMTFADTYHDVLDLIENPSAYGKLSFIRYLRLCRIIITMWSESSCLLWDQVSSIPTRHAAMWTQAWEGFVSQTQSYVQIVQNMCFGMLTIPQKLQILCLQTRCSPTSIKLTILPMLPSLLIGDCFQQRLHLSD